MWFRFHEQEKQICGDRSQNTHYLKGWGWLGRAQGNLLWDKIFYILMWVYKHTENPSRFALKFMNFYISYTSVKRILKHNSRTLWEQVKTRSTSFLCNKTLRNKQSRAGADTKIPSGEPEWLWLLAAFSLAYSFYPHGHKIALLALDIVSACTKAK